MASEQTNDIDKSHTRQSVKPGIKTLGKKEGSSEEWVCFYCMRVMEVVFPVNLEISMKLLSSPKTEISKLIQIEPSFNTGLKEV